MGRAARAVQLTSICICAGSWARSKMHMGMHSSVHVHALPHDIAFNRR
jgi:hypothetical protein